MRQPRHEIQGRQLEKKKGNENEGDEMIRLEKHFSSADVEEDPFAAEAAEELRWHDSAPAAIVFAAARETEGKQI